MHCGFWRKQTLPLIIVNGGLWVENCRTLVVLDKLPKLSVRSCPYQAQLES